MCIFQSKQVIKLWNAQISLGKKWMATEFARSQSIGLSCVGHDAGGGSQVTDSHLTDSHLTETDRLDRLFN